MKKIIFILLAASLLTACQKADDNGELGGFWKLLQIEELNSDSVIDKRNEDRFWAIQLRMIATNNGDKGRFQHIEDSLFIQMAQEFPGCKEYGFYNPTDERFHVNKLENRSMILQSDEVILRFRKF